MRRPAGLLLALLASAGRLSAADSAPDYTPTPWPQPPGATEMLLRLGLLTALALASAAVVLWLVRHARRLPPPKQGAGALDLVARVPLDGRCTLHLLQVDEHCFLVGTDTTGLKVIQLVTEPFEQALHDVHLPPTAALGLHEAESPCPSGQPAEAPPPPTALR